MGFRLPVPAKDDRPIPKSYELATAKADGLHDASLHADILGADDKRVIWIRPAGPIRVRL